MHAVRLTPLGLELFGQDDGSGDGRVLVNPDFELMLFADGLSGLRLEHRVARFAERLSADRVRRYRVTRESMRDGIRAGMSLEDIRTTLTQSSPHPLPRPVEVALSDWSEDLDWIEVVPSYRLTGVPAKRRDEVIEVLEEHELEVLETVAGELVVSDPTHRCDVSALVRTLQEEGWLVRRRPTATPAMSLDADDEE